jgi:hypothetical protein
MAALSGGTGRVSGKRRTDVGSEPVPTAGVKKRPGPAAVLKGCSQCALQLCGECQEASTSGFPQFCHRPDTARSVCRSCAVNHRTCSISLDRALLLRRGVASALNTEIDTVHPAIAPFECFAYFYVDFGGLARAFELFDAGVWVDNHICSASVYLDESIQFLFIISH